MSTPRNKQIKRSKSKSKIPRLLKVDGQLEFLPDSINLTREDFQDESGYEKL
jgi:hypothetical protein